MPPRLLGRSLNMLLAPVKGTGRKPAAPADAPAPE